MECTVLHKRQKHNSTPAVLLCSRYPAGASLGVPVARAGRSGRLTPDLSSPAPPNQQQPAPGSRQPGAEGKCCNVQEMNQLVLNYTQLLGSNIFFNVSISYHLRNDPARVTT